MKKIFISTLVLLIIFTTVPLYSVKAANTAKTKITKTQTITKVTWSSSGLRELRKVPRAIRPSVKAKIEAYAKKHKIKVITAKIYNSIHI